MTSCHVNAKPKWVEMGVFCQCVSVSETNKNISILIVKHAIGLLLYLTNIVCHLPPPLQFAASKGSHILGNVLHLMLGF